MDDCHGNIIRMVFKKTKQICISEITKRIKGKKQFLRHLFQYFFETGDTTVCPHRKREVVRTLWSHSVDVYLDRLEIF